MDFSRLSSAEKRRLLAALLQRKIGQIAAVNVPPHAPGAAEWPLSVGQRANWLLHHRNPLAPVVVAFAARLAARPDTAALRRAAQCLLDRHPVLTCGIHERDGRPVQVVGTHPRVDFAAVDATRWRPAERNSHVLDEAHRPFDLSRDPLVRIRLYESDGPPTLLISVHQIVTDLRSFQVLLEDFDSLYAAECGGPPPPPPAACTYGDFVRWQANVLASPEGDRLWAYWRDRLAGDRPAPHLDTGRSRPVALTSRGGVRRFVLADGLVSRLREVAWAEGATPYMILLAAFQIVLHRHTGQDDILVGSPVAARGPADFNRVAGDFANMVVLRSDFSDDPPFRDLLSRVRRDVLGALEHQDFPFALLVERLQLTRDPGRSPVFQAVFALQQAGDLERRAAFGGLAFTAVPLDCRTADFELALTLREEGAGLRGYVQYRSDVFEPASADWIIAQYQTLLEAVAANPSRHVSELPLRGATER